MQFSPVIWTIGHSNHTFQRFAGLLRAEGIEVVVKVRSYPYSRIAPHFNRKELEQAICGVGTRYLFFGGGGSAAGHHRTSTTMRTATLATT